MRTIRWMALLLCLLLCASCASNTGGGDGAATEATPTDEAVIQEVPPSPEPEEGPYAQVSVSATVGHPVQARRAAEPGPLEMLEDVRVQPRYDLPGEVRSLAVMHTDCFAVVGVDEQGRDCVYGGDIHAMEAPRTPLYVAEEAYPSIGSVTGGYGCVYIAEGNDAVWRIRLINLLVGANESDAPVLIDHGEGPIPALASSEGNLVYAVEAAQGYELRVFSRRSEPGGATEPLGVLQIPQDTLQPEGAYFMNSMGVTHVERSGEGYLAIAEDLDGIRSAIASKGPLSGAQLGSLALAWLEDGTFCVYDPEGDVTYRYGEDITWFTPRDIAGEGAGYLFGGPGDLYMMSWDLLTDPLEMAVYAIAEGDGWNYLECAVEVDDTNIAYVIRQRDDWWQLAYVELNEAFG